MFVKGTRIQFQVRVDRQLVAGSIWELWMPADQMVKPNHLFLKTGQKGQLLMPNRANTFGISEANLNSLMENQQIKILSASAQSQASEKAEIRG